MYDLHICTSLKQTAEMVVAIAITLQAAIWVHSVREATCDVHAVSHDCAVS